MDGAAAWVLLAAGMTVLLAGVHVECKARVCYFGPPPEPDPDNPDHWMKQVMQEIRERCPGKKQPTPAGECPSPGPLGMEDRIIPDERITASSSYQNNPASAARLNGKNSWVTGSPTKSWIEVDLVEATVVTGLITQGRAGWYVTEYTVAYQKQPLTVYKHVIEENGDIKVFIGNTDSVTPVTNRFDQSVEVTVVRIEPTSWGGYGVSLRLELLGCRR